MWCPVCGETTRVINSRVRRTTNSVRRRRVCDSCGYRMTTYENVPAREEGIASIRRATICGDPQVQQAALLAMEKLGLRERLK